MTADLALLPDRQQLPPSRWAVVTIADLLHSGVIRAHKDGNHGSNYPRAAEFGDKGIPFLTAKLLDDGHIDIDGAPRLPDERADSLRIGFVQPEDVLLSHNATIGRVAVVPTYTGRLLIGTSLTYFRLDKTRLIPNYLAAFFRGAYFQNQLKAFMSHSTRNQVPITAQRHLQIVVPPLEEQLAITSILDAFNDRIDLLRQTNTTLEAIAQALFKSWFVDFDPVHANADAQAHQLGTRSGQPSKPQPSDVPRPEAKARAGMQREPQAAAQERASSAAATLPAALMDAATAALFPSEFEESELGLIPNGWQAGRLGDIASNPRDQAKPDRIDPDTPYLGLEHMPRKSIALGDHGTAGGLGSGKFWFEESDILFGKLRPYFHKVGLAPFKGICSTDILVLRPLEPTFHALVLAHASSDALIDYATRLSNGAKMPRSSWKDISNYQICVPSAHAARAFNELVEPMFERIKTNVRAASTLAQLRDTLLPRLISGKLRLPDATKAAEAALA